MRLALTALFFLFGVGVASFATLPSKLPLYIILAAVFVLIFSRRHGRVIIGTFFAIAFAFGLVRFEGFIKQNSVLASFRDIKAGNREVDVIMRGYVSGEGSASEKSYRFLFVVKELQVVNRSFSLDEKILVTSSSYPRFSYGAFLEIDGSVQSPKNFDNFDYVAYLKKDGIQNVTAFPKIKEISKLDLSLLENFKLSLFKNIFGFKDRFSKAINQSLPEPNAAYVSGVLTGTRQGIPDSLKEAFNRTSTSHILAISGYNISILFEVITWVLVFFMMRRKAFWLAVVLIIVFTILTGASASVVRAAVMGFLVYFARSYGRIYDPKNSIILAAAIMVAINPMLLRYDVGFQLSFLAVIGLVYLYPWLDYKLAKLPKLGQTKEILLMSLSAQIMVAPLIFFYFKTFSLISLLANILVLPFVPVVMGLGFAAGLAGMIWSPLGQVIGLAAWALSTYQLEVIKILAALPFASI